MVLGVGLRDLWVVCRLQVALSWLLANSATPINGGGASTVALCRRLKGAYHAFMATETNRGKPAVYAGGVGRLDSCRLRYARGD